MGLRLLEIIASKETAERIAATMQEESPVPPHWLVPMADGYVQVRVILDMESLEGITDHIEHHYTLGESSRILIHSLEAVIPRLVDEEQEEEAEDAAAADGSKDKETDQNAQRLHREELFSNLYDEAKLTKNHLMLVVLAAIVAALGLMRDSEVILVGSMVIAPLLGPQLALSFAGVMGERTLLRQALRTMLCSMLLGIIASALIGLCIAVDTQAAAIQQRTSPDVLDLVLALAAGAAGTLCYTMGQATAVVGVMVAAALMPPLAAAGLLVGHGEWRPALGALALLASNVIGINAAGMAVCVYQGIRPGSWVQQQEATRSAQMGLALWVALLAGMAGVLWWFYS